MSDEEEQQLLSDTATILKMDPPWDVTEDALHAAERALFAITKAVHHYKWHRQVLGDFWMARAVLVLKPYDGSVIRARSRVGRRGIFVETCRPSIIKSTERE